MDRQNGEHLEFVSSGREVTDVRKAPLMPVGNCESKLLYKLDIRKPLDWWWTLIDREANSLLVEQSHFYSNKVQSQLKCYTVHRWLLCCYSLVTAWAPVGYTEAALYPA